MLRIMSVMVLIGAIFAGVVFFLLRSQQGSRGASPQEDTDKSRGSNRSPQGKAGLVAASADSRLVAALDAAAQTVRVWDANTGKLVKTLRYDGDYFPNRINDAPRAGLCFSRDGKRLVFKGGNQALVMWNLPSGVATTMKPGQKAAVSPDAEILAAVDFIDMKVTRLDTGEVIRTVSFESPAEIGKFIVSPDHRYVFGERYEFESDGDGQWVQLYLLDLNTGTRTQIARMAKGARATGVQDEVVSMVFSPDGSRVVTLDAGGKIKVWSIPDGREVWQTGLVTTRGLDYAVIGPDNRSLAAVYDAAPYLNIHRTHVWRPVIVLWTVGVHEGREFKAPVGSPVSDLSFSPDGKRLYFSNKGDTLQALDVASRTIVKVYGTG